MNPSLTQLGLAFIGNFSLDNLRFSFFDILDVFFIAVLIYFVFKLVYETRSFPIIIGISTVLFLYGLATILSLSLTRSILQSFLSIFIILIVVVFQNEFRRFLTFFNLAPYFLKRRSLSEQVTSIIGATVEHFAENKIGAILVFPGKEFVEQHISGGFDLDGKISEPLLLSIFDPSTPGHDGAVVIDGDRLVKFGCHLPLARSLKAVQGFGTRHRAGVGLSERSDALIVIVSEEKGSVSIAQNGVLLTIHQKEELEKIIKKFYEEKFPVRDRSHFLHFGVRNILFFIATLVLASGVWVYNNQSSPLAQKKIVVPFEFQNVPAEYVVSEIAPQELVITLESRASNFDTLKTEGMRAPIDLKDAGLGWRRFVVDPTKIKVPFEFTIVKVDPDNLSLRIVKKETALPSQESQ